MWNLLAISSIMLNNLALTLIDNFKCHKWEQKPVIWVQKINIKFIKTPTIFQNDQEEYIYKEVLANNLSVYNTMQ